MRYQTTMSTLHSRTPPLLSSFLFLLRPTYSLHTLPLRRGAGILALLKNKAAWSMEPEGPEAETHAAFPTFSDCYFNFRPFFLFFFAFFSKILDLLKRTVKESMCVSGEYHHAKLPSLQGLYQRHLRPPPQKQTKAQKIHLVFSAHHICRRIQ